MKPKPFLRCLDIFHWSTFHPSKRPFAKPQGVTDHDNKEPHFERVKSCAIADHMGEPHQRQNTGIELRNHGTCA
jgi:hypothetical protein